MGSVIANTRFKIIIMSSLPDSYHPTLQAITLAEKATRLSGSTSKSMLPNDLIAFIIEEAQHQVINDECTKTAESALTAHTKTVTRPRGKGKNKSKNMQSDITCDNCNAPSHSIMECWSKGGRKEGQGLRQKNKKNKQPETAIVAVKDDKNKLFTFTCTSDYAAVVKKLDLPKSKLGMCVDSGASRDYCPDRSKFVNYQTVERTMTTANGKSMKAVGMGDLQLELPNRSKKSKMLFKNAIHALEMAFTLISISRLDKAGFSATFHKGMCTIKNLSNQTVATIPHTNGLYKIVATSPSNKAETANTVSGKMSISEAHRKLGHISYSAIKHMISNGFITGIELDSNSKPDFCKACAKAKSAQQPFHKESEIRATKYGECVHWDLWGPTAIKSLNGHFYMAAQIDDALRETKLYFQVKKSEMFESYKINEANIEAQTGNHIKYMCSDQGGEFKTDAMRKHQDQKGTEREFTVHDLPPQNGVAERGMRTRAE